MVSLKSCTTSIITYIHDIVTQSEKLFCNVYQRVPVSRHFTLKEPWHWYCVFTSFFQSYLWRNKRRDWQHERRRLCDARDEAGSQSGTKWVSSSPPKTHQGMNLSTETESKINKHCVNTSKHFIIEAIELCIKLFWVSFVI